MGFWLACNMTVTVILFTVTLVFLVRRARRERRLTPELALYLATLCLGWMEAVIDWGAFVYYSPDWPHFPTSGPIVRLVPILPLHIALCYTWFFFGGAWLAVRLARATTARFPRLRMTPMLWMCGFAIGFLLDFAVENYFIGVAGSTRSSRRVGRWLNMNVKRLPAAASSSPVRTLIGMAATRPAHAERRAHEPAGEQREAGQLPREVLPHRGEPEAVGRGGRVEEHDSGAVHRVLALFELEEQTLEAGHTVHGDLR